jgi:hypothetical protein
MRKPPAAYRDRNYKFSFRAGYRNGFEDKPTQVKLRGSDVKPAYRDGRIAGVKDRKAREKRLRKLEASA